MRILLDFEKNEVCASDIVAELYWVKHVFDDIDQIVDLGNMTDSTLEFLSKIYPCAEVITCNRNIVIDSHSKFFKIDDFEKIKAKENSVLVLSSIIHQIYAYYNADEIRLFWDSILEKKFKYIVIKDTIFIPGADDCFTTLTAVRHVRESSYKERLDEYERSNGKIESLKDLNQFFLKYKYNEEVWQKELNKNYFSCRLGDISTALIHMYKCEYQNIFFSPKCKNHINQDFKLSATGNTHVESIYRLR